ncbi:MAG: CDC48 family AAA ATPase [Methanospirillum sp.]|uniref:CDC48 family AAA ATPase n=1 Tax=Methanospirillum sp. TaxID=45200 RepID=UPI00236A8B7E|nr:CDC48 family AAA ATPase [Methanospirillum sp.]MDD1728774.1 CDC48 family AAA ATPase [Methanospirillum sp.]
MPTIRDVTLIVQEAPVQDKGKDIARISWETMEKTGLLRGDVIEIEGVHKTYAIVAPSSSPWADVIFIDGNIRRRAGVGIREQAVIRKGDAKEAEKVEFQIVQDVQGLEIRELEQFLSEQLKGSLLFQGKDIAIPVGSSTRDPFDDFFGSRDFGGGMFWNSQTTYAIVRITATNPEGAVIATPKTRYSVVRTGRQASTSPGRSGSQTVQSGEGSEKGKYIPDIHYEDIGGLERELSQVREMIELPLRNPDLFNHLGIEPPKGVLLYGPPGTGKTLIAKAVANEVNAHFITLSGPEIMNKYYGESEGKLREVFEEAEEHAPSIIFIDEIDSIAPKREDTKGEVERRIVAQLLSLMDGLKSRGRVIVIAATNLPDNLDPALRRGGRFDREIEIGIPDVSGRMAIFQIHSQRVPLDLLGITIGEDQLTRDERIQISRLDEDIKNLESRRSSEERNEHSDEPERRFVDIKAQKEEVENQIKRRLFLQPFANQTHGFVGADISLTVKEAAMHALRKGLEKVPPKDLKEGKIDKNLIAAIRVSQGDFQAALSHVEPSAMREVLIEVPDISWDQVGGLEEVKKDLREAVEWPLKYPQLFSHLKTKTPKGILLFGPPGTGKTLMAKAVSHESECNFISVKGPELISKWVGESEKGIREVFRKARQAAPSIIFFDEIDSLVPKRGNFSDATHVTESVVSQILTEMDGMEELKNVTIIAATNRPDMLDDALMRPGRLERHIFVPPPDKDGRKQIFEVYLKDAGNLLTADVTIDHLVEKTEGYVGADIEALIREAKLAAMREFITLMTGRTNRELEEAVSNVRITRRHFDEAFGRVRGSLDDSTHEQYIRQSWQILYNQDQQRILEKAAQVIGSAKTLGIPEDELQSLKDEVYNSGTKDFSSIETHTQELDNKYHPI